MKNKIPQEIAKGIIAGALITRGGPIGKQLEYAVKRYREEELKRLIKKSKEK